MASLDPAIDSFALAIGYQFRDPSLLRVALTHRSAAHEVASARKGTPATDNERLEFLGDAVLAIMVSEHLWLTLPHAAEGELTRMRAGIVNEASLARVATALGLGEALKLGRGEDRSGGRSKPSLLANAFEAVIAAVYLDGGHEAARTVVIRLLEASIGEVRARGNRDQKTLLQEMFQGRHGITPHYEVCGTEGPDHARTYTVEMHAGEMMATVGVGRSKKAAEQDAARKALESIESSDGQRTVEPHEPSPMD